MKINNFIASLPIWLFYAIATAGFLATVTVDWFIQQDWENAVIRSFAAAMFAIYAHVIIKACRKERDLAQNTRTEAVT